MRGVILGDYDTALDGWILSELSFSAPEQITNYVSIPGRQEGPLDLSTALADGVPSYNSRTLTILLTCVEGTRASRMKLVSDLTTAICGKELKIILPDTPTRYIVGRNASIDVAVNGLAYTTATISFACEPWFYVDMSKAIPIGYSGNYPAPIIVKALGNMPAVPTFVVGSDLNTAGDLHIRFYGVDHVVNGAGEYSFEMAAPLQSNITCAVDVRFSGSPTSLVAGKSITIKWKEGLLWA